MKAETKTKVRKTQSAADQREELLEALDSVSAAFETVMCHFNNKMPAGDALSRNRLVYEARELVRKYRPDAS